MEKDSAYIYTVTEIYQRLVILWVSLDKVIYKKAWTKKINYQVKENGKYGPEQEKSSKMWVTSWRFQHEVGIEI